MISRDAKKTSKECNWKVHVRGEEEEGRGEEKRRGGRSGGDLQSRGMGKERKVREEEVG